MGSLIISCSQSILGCYNFFKIFNSSTTKSIANLSPAFCFESFDLSISFRANFVFVFLSVQRYTFEKLPLPRSDSMTYWFTRRFPNFKKLVDTTDEVLLIEFWLLSWMEFPFLSFYFELFLKVYYLLKKAWGLKILEWTLVVRFPISKLSFFLVSFFGEKSVVICLWT